MILKKVFVGILLIGFIGCQTKGEQKIENANFNMAVRTSEQTGIRFENTLKDQSDLNIIEYLYYYN